MFISWPKKGPGNNLQVKNSSVHKKHTQKVKKKKKIKLTVISSVESRVKPIISQRIISSKSWKYAEISFCRIIIAFGIRNEQSSSRSMWLSKLSKLQLP